MNKYFWTWLLSCACYAAGIIILVVVNTTNVRSVAYLSSEVCQVAALVGTVYACNTIKNIPHHYFALKYGIICIGFFTVYMYYYGMTQGVYVLLLVFKLVAVIMILYIILVKWDFQFIIKVLGLLVFGLMVCCFAAARDGLDKTIQSTIDGSCAPGVFPLVSVPTVVGCAGALLIVVAAIATPIARTQKMRELWFYVMSGGAVLKIATMEIARLVL